MSTKEKRFYDWFINLLASVLLVVIWRAAAWGGYHLGWTDSEDRLFMFIVAGSVALHLPSNRRKAS